MTISHNTVEMVMKKINRFFILAKDENEYNEIGDMLLPAFFDISCYLRFLNNNHSIMLNNLFTEKIEILDHHNIVIDFEEIKKILKINGNFAKFSEKSDNFDKISINKDCLGLDNESATKMCKKIYSTLLPMIVSLDGTLVS